MAALLSTRFTCLTLFLLLTIVSVINPSNGKLITKVDEATSADVDRAVKAAHKAFETEWGLNASGARRSELLNKLASLMEKNHDELAALEALDNGTSRHLLSGSS